MRSKLLQVISQLCAFSKRPVVRKESDMLDIFGDCRDLALEIGVIHVSQLGPRLFVFSNVG